MNTNAVIGIEPEKDRWWLIGVSILLQQLMLSGAYIAPHELHASSAPVAIIWIMSFILPWAYSDPVPGKAYLRSCAKIGWLYVLAAVISVTCSLCFFEYQFGGLTVSKLP